MKALTTMLRDSMLTPYIENSLIDQSRKARQAEENVPIQWVIREAGFRLSGFQCWHWHAFDMKALHCALC
jgi:hypothetical protein